MYILLLRYSLIRERKIYVTRHDCVWSLIFSFQVLSSVVDDYYPWGKPGHGAPNDDGFRKRKIFSDPPSPPWKVGIIYINITLSLPCGGFRNIRKKKSDSNISDVICYMIPAIINISKFHKFHKFHIFT